MNAEVQFEVLSRALSLAWDQDTASGIWYPGVPSMNQCAVTALVVQDYLGGDLLRCPMTDGNSHYWNRAPNGIEIDLTIQQFLFTEAMPIKQETIVRYREYVLSYPDTLRRYEILRKRVKEIIGD